MSDFRQILIRYWGYSHFRPLQEEIIQSVAGGNDTLGLMPTGGGKSITFQVYSLAREGICIVITPLISLMKDQVENLNQKGIKALAIHSGMTQQEIKIAMDSAVWGNYKFLYLSPERLATPRFRERVGDMNVNLVTVDEAHCISQWGYDFRPSYLKIQLLRELLPEVPVLALTATATPKVIDDIQDKLNFRGKNVLRKSFFRENLIYMVRNIEDKQGYLLQSALKAKGTGIVYVCSRKLTRELSELLQKNKISADYYHAGLSAKSRAVKQENWKTGRTRVIVATNAFGMGIDKPDVRFVINYDAPDSLEAYFQEAGRAGRDGNKAYGVLLFNNSDKLKLQKSVAKTFPEPDMIRKVYNALCNHLQIAVGFGKDQLYDFSIADFSRHYKIDIATILSSLKILQREGYLELTEELDNPSRVYFCVDRDDLYRFQVANSSFDGFIKLLLRSYTGLFSNYVPVDEELLARRANISVEAVYKFLNTLDTYKIINYIPRKKTPFIIMNVERIEIDRLKISKENYDDRKKDYIHRIQSVIHYAESTHKCRSQLLLQYFGETNTTRCGKCDTCLERNELNLSKYEFDMIGMQVKKILETPCSYNDLLKKAEGQKDTVIKTIRWLLDNEKIIYRVDNLLEWKKTSGNSAMH
ncbi:MAG: ATP-dependent DNA helicase RecQ [Prolixibacteraceae bacterium]|nr:ATP-dependent DNA helicase RecQ [Prolixibacteraceae bacterium]